MSAHGDRSTGPPLALAVDVFSTGTDSPVRTASSHSRPRASSSRRSAGMMSPTSRTTMSPGTSAVTSIAVSRPSRIVRAVGRSWAWRSAIARALRYSLMNPSPTLIATMPKMMAASIRSRDTSETMAVPARRRRNGLLSWPQSSLSVPSRWLRSALDPTSARRRVASLVVRPVRVVCSRPSTSSAGKHATVARSGSASPSHSPEVLRAGGISGRTAGSRSLRCDTHSSGRAPPPESAKPSSATARHETLARPI